MHAYQKCRVRSVERICRSGWERNRVHAEASSDTNRRAICVANASTDANANAIVVFINASSDANSGNSDSIVYDITISNTSTISNTITSTRNTNSSTRYTNSSTNASTRITITSTRNLFANCWRTR